MKYSMQTITILFTLVIISGCADSAAPYTAQPQSRDLLDLDSDGVINARDLCKQTLHGAKIDNSGCANSLNQVQEKTKVIMFDFDSDKLSQESEAQVAALLEKLMELPAAKLLLIGDTSPEGSKSYNHKLAQRRVDTIHNIAKKVGFPTQDIFTQTFDQKDRTNTSISGRGHRLIAVGQWQESGAEMMWTIFTSEQKSK